MFRRNQPLKPLLNLILLSLALALLISCQASQAPGETPAGPQEEPAGEGEQIEVTRVVSETVEEEEAGPITPIAPSPTAVVVATQPPLATGAVAGTAAAVEQMAEVDFPPRMRLGESDVVRLSLLPAADGYVVTADFAGHQAVTETVALEQLAGYDVIAAARLDGVGFNLSPRGEQPQDWQPGRPLTWRWTISPRRAGQQRLSVNLTMQWRPEPGRSLPSRQVTALSRALDVQVVGLLGMSTGQVIAAGLVGLLLVLVVATPLLGRMRRRERPLRQVQPDPELALEPHPALSLDAEEQALLQALFRGYSRAAVEREFQSGYSGARTFLVLPIRDDGRADAYTIAKLGPRQAILREYENYETYVEHTLPPITARIQGRPVTLNGRHAGRRTPGRSNGAFPAAAIRYTFIGGPGQQPLSLRQRLLDGGGPALLETLFRTFGPNWWMQRRPYSFRLALEYDRKLPAHYILSPAAGIGALLDGRLPPTGMSFSIGEQLLLRHFTLVEHKDAGRSVTLVGEAQPGHPPLRLRWLGTNPPDGAVGRVVASRETLLQQWTAGFERHDLPNPVAILPTVLARTISGSRSIIHGDLNLENALVGPGDFVWLIDFANTREAHTLFDFAHLGAELVAHVLTTRYATPHAYLAALAAGEEPLLAKLEEIAARCLVDPQKAHEYCLPLYLSCLGGLKHDNLDERARRFLYLTAAYLVEISELETRH